jgi:hypothetical protein
VAVSQKKEGFIVCFEQKQNGKSCVGVRLLNNVLIQVIISLWLLHIKLDDSYVLLI